MIYPFAALVGQERLVRALLLCAVHPGIGGVLIQGDKGTAKSTAARGLAEILPPVRRAVGSPLNLSPEETDGTSGAELVPAPFVTLPLGASEDRVIGQLDLETVLTERRRTLQPGLLAAAHQGILYIDEVNLLPDHLVDVLLDVAASGVNTIQRDGLSVSHPSRFFLIGTMNPEEGSLRPQFLDRFGLMVHVHAPDDPVVRAEVIRRRIAFEREPAVFRQAWQETEDMLKTRILAARALLRHVRLSDELLLHISQLCRDAGVQSLRADIVLYKTALAWAALEQRNEVTESDIQQASELVLAHRRKNRQPDRPSGGSPEPPQIDPPAGGSEKQEEVFGILPTGAAPVIEVRDTGLAGLAGRRSQTPDRSRGPVVRTTPSPFPTELALEASIRQALLRDPDNAGLTRQDLQQAERSGKTGHFLLFVVDASGSMAANRRMEAVKGTILSLLTDAYQKRDTVGLITFRGAEAQVVLAPTQRTEHAEEALRSLPTGGRTPLAHALLLAEELVRFGPENPLLVIVSDGKANVPLPGGGDPIRQALTIAGRLAGTPAIVLNTEIGFLPSGQAARLAEALQAPCLSPEAFSSENILRLLTSYRKK
ncbi:magnesium chelatase subunit D family protein [Siphonobacter aquaeclarae]|uniref:Mg-protoporphyrin IX chelatase n=1 Tax=Siphonobacter aquaeclarae TaxID=563176 RepID=A0A1G9IFN6_9BACT|nr:magnesium chelatase subunit D family protein [Siphonobacter aquaeclarae]SDL23664.1 protoporphyrin IX magnesium-chelatase [Siphonobacter aquaeclarae]